MNSFRTWFCVGMNLAYRSVMAQRKGLQGLFNFKPSVRPVPLEAHIQGYPGKFYCPRMATMNKPAYAAIQTHSPTKPVLIFVSRSSPTRPYHTRSFILLWLFCHVFHACKANLRGATELPFLHVLAETAITRGPGAGSADICAEQTHRYSA